MNLNTNSLPNSIESDYRSFRVRTLKIFGGIHIGLGVVCGILSLVGVFVNGIDLNRICKYSYYYHDYGYKYSKDNVYVHYSHCNDNASLLFGFNVTCLILSAWCFLTGMFPFCMNSKRRNSWKCLKIAFMVCSILGASVFMPTVIIIATIGASVSIDFVERDELNVPPTILAVFALIEMVVSIVAASYCCCCTLSEDTNNRQIVYIASYTQGFQNVILTDLSATQNQMTVQRVHISTTTRDNRSSRQQLVRAEQHQGGAKNISQKSPDNRMPECQPPPYHPAQLSSNNQSDQPPPYQP